MQSKKRYSSSGGEPLEGQLQARRRRPDTAAGSGYGGLEGGSSVNHGALASGSGTGMEWRNVGGRLGQTVSVVKTCKSSGV